MARLQREFVVLGRFGAPPPYQDTAAWKRGLQPVWREAPALYVHHWGAGRGRSRGTEHQVGGGWTAKSRVQAGRHVSETRSCLPAINSSRRGSTHLDEEYSQGGRVSDEGSSREEPPAPSAKQLIQQYRELREAAARRRTESDAARDAVRLAAEARVNVASAGVVSALRGKQASMRRSVVDAARSAHVDEAPGSTTPYSGAGPFALN